ncbi:protein FAM83G [Paramormyrops kingsleyae]|uniref:protein FAM83G n=1 Tax=Paramormyrops kingsleyae TaxID=1676925 RepID=UPI003B97ABAD
MALSQVQCLDENHVNWRMNESKPEFFYSEDQRLALEALIQEGKDAFQAYIMKHQLRDFLSEVELDRLSGIAEVYQPGSDHPRGDGIEGGEDAAESLQYWPERSDTSIPNLDMGWPDYTSYRGVTRANVYTQPPQDGQTHIKEVVRKTIVQAQKVIAVVMDLFTDVDIFKDLLDASFKRKVAVYIILEADGVPYFLNMCERARMHRGHLKNLRVRSIEGTEFYTRSSKKVCGRMTQKFIFVDGDRAISGSYSFTWTASRLDRNLITVLTGQAVETFDKQFRELYLTSRGVNLSKINLEDEPEPEPIPQSAPVPLPSAAIARKLINPKYALVTSSATETCSRTSSDKHSAKNEGANNAAMKPLQRQLKEPVELPPIHPGLLNLERVNMMAYLPTWPEPDPPSDVIGFINIRDTSKPMQAHLMRSELFETSQAIRFKDPFVAPVEPLPEKVCLKKKPEDPPVSAHQQKLPESPLQSAQDEPDISKQPKDQTPHSKPTMGTEDKPVPPVPKRRTVQLVIRRDSNADMPEISIIKKTNPEPEIPPDQVINSIKTMGPPHNVSTSVTPPQEATLEGIGDVTKEDQRDVIARIRVTDDTNKADSVEVFYANSPSSTMPDECFESNFNDVFDSSPALMVNGMQAGSGRMRGHREPDGLKVMARLSQSMLDLRSEDQPQEQKEVDDQQAQPNNSTALERNQVPFHKLSERKLLLSSSKSPTNIISPDQQREERWFAKVIIAKPGSYHRPTKAVGHVIGGHRYWQGKTTGLEKTSSGCKPPNRFSRGQLGNSRYDRLFKHHKHELGQVGICATGQPISHSSYPHKSVPTQVENCTLPTKLSQFKQVRGRTSGTALDTLQRKTQLGHKAAV